MDLSVIIVSYNVRAYLEALLQSLPAALGGLSAEIFVVDNGSTDGTVPLLRANYPTLKLVANRYNMGFAAANNQALVQAQGDYLLLLNPDTLLQPDSLRVMSDFMVTHPQVGAAGCKVLNRDGTLQLACRRSFPTPASAFFKLMGLSRLFPHNRWIARYNLTYLDPDRVQEVDAVSGAFLMVRREVVEQVGLLDPAYFLYGEDLDWLYRIRKAGWRVCYVPLTQIVHYQGASVRQVRWNARIAFYGAMLRFVWKHRYPPSIIGRWVITIGIIARGALAIAGEMIWGFIRFPIDAWKGKGPSGTEVDLLQIDTHHLRRTV